jgi:hypothetical protein
MTASGSNWQLWRQDDNGHHFLVGTYPTKEAAESRMAELTGGHHKQTYWVSEEADTGHILPRSVK